LLDLIVKTFIAYQLGSILGSLVLGKLRGVDIRTQGSGNAGGTNALRTQGAWFALGVMIIDVGKGWFSATHLPSLFQIGGGDSWVLWTPIACATAAVLGHVYPVWFEFRGGKGAATLIGVVMGLTPTATLPVMAVWLVVLMLSGYVGLATMCATAAFPLYAYWLLDSVPLTAFGVAMTAFVIYTHRGNIARMRAGTENRSQRLWLLRPR